MASTIKVNNIQNQCGANIVNKCSTTITLGASGDTIQLACGASQTGFGRTGTVDWNTTAITADPANAVSGTGYFANTTSAAFTITLPTSPSAGDIVAVRDYAQTFATNNLTIGRNGQPIDGQTFDLVLSTNGAAVTLVYVDGTQGWKSVNSNEIVNQELFITATGGTETTCGDYKIHTFTGPGTFTVTCAGNAAGSNTVDYLVVAGGAGGGGGIGGGGGAGGYRESSGTASGCYTASPLGACVSALPVSAQGYPITVGGGGAGGPAPSTTNAEPGSNSVFSTITSTGGGRGGYYNVPGANSPPFFVGGSGGGAGGNGSAGQPGTGGAGNTPPVSPPQGNPGGNAIVPTEFGAGGGGGATTSGINASPGPSGTSGGGGSGATTSISASPTTYAGGGGGGGSNYYGPSAGGAGGPGGGGAGGNGGGSPTSSTAGTTNTGGGGGGGAQGPPQFSGAAGGSGIVIIRYKYQ